MDFPRLFDAVADRMRLDFEEARASLNHPGLKGASFEDAFRQFLRKYLPPKLDISQGTAVDSTGSSSKQLDVILCDAHSTPVFYEAGGARVVPIETVYSVIEVKANLTRDELSKCLDNMMSVRTLTKRAFQPGTHSPVAMYGQVFPWWPVNYFVFAIDSAPLDSLCDFLTERYQTNRSPVFQRIDTICVLNRGVILNSDASGMYDALPSPSSKMGFITTKRSLLLFYALANRYWFQTTLPPFNVVPYLRNMVFGENEA